MRDRLDYQLHLSRRVALVDAIQELAQLPPDFSSSDASSNATSGPGAWLSDEYRQILNHQEDIRKEWKDRQRSVEYLAGIVTDLFVDYHRIQGADVRHRIPSLQQHVLNMNLASATADDYFNGIVKFFTSK